MTSQTPPQLTHSLLQPTLQHPQGTFSPRTSMHAEPSFEGLQSRMCDPLVVYHSCGHISEFSCSVGRSFQPGEVHESCTFNVLSMEELEGVCGVCIERGTVSSEHSSNLLTSEHEVIEVERGHAYAERQAEEVVVPLQERVRLKFRGLRLKIRGWIFQVTRVECEFSSEPQTLQDDYRELIVAFGEEAEEIWIKARATEKRIRGWVCRVVREDDEVSSDREIVGRLVGRPRSG